MSGRSISQRRRVLRRANVRAQRRFHEMMETGLFFDEQATVTRLYVEAERLIDRLLVSPHPTPVAVVVESLRWPVTVLSRDDEGFEAIATYTSRMDEYQTRGA